MKKKFHCLIAILIPLILCAGCGDLSLSESADYAAIKDKKMQDELTALFDEENILIADYADPENIIQKIPITYDAYQVYLSMADENCGCLLYCSSPAMGQMNKIIYQTDDRWQTYTTTDISSQIDGYPNSFTMKSAGEGYIGIDLRNTDYLYRTADKGITWNAVFIDKNITNCNGYAPVFDESGETACCILDMKSDAAYSYQLYRSTDGGETFQLAGSFSLEDSLSHYFLYEDELFITDTPGNIYKISL